MFIVLSYSCYVVLLFVVLCSKIKHIKVFGNELFYYVDSKIT
jgi:hypothetical protein